MSDNEIEKTSTRFYSIDTMRGLGIIFMIGAHFIWTWSILPNNPHMDVFGGIMSEFISFLGGLSWLFFIFIVGLSLSISQSKQRSKGIDEKSIWRYSFVRGLIIFFLGYFTNLVLWGLNDKIFTTDILQFIGFSLMVTSTLNYVIRRFSASDKSWQYFRVVLFIFFLISSTLLSRLNGFSMGLPTMNFFDVILSILFYGFFPFFSFYSYMLLGSIIGESGIFKTEIGDLDVNKYILKSIIVVLMIFIPLFFIIFDFRFLYIGITLITFLFLFWFQDLRKRGISNPIQRNIARISWCSLSIYFIQWAFINWSIDLFGVSLHNNVLFSYVLISYIVFMAFLLFFVVLWEKKNYKFGLEWLIAKLNTKPVVALKSD